MRNEKGQVLLPGLALFLGLLCAFFLVVVGCRKELRQMRLQTAAIAGALSAARAQAQLLNDCAAYNLTLNGFLPLRFGRYAATHVNVRNAFVGWLEAVKWVNRSKAVENFWKGTLGYPQGVAKHVSRLNGAERGLSWNPLTLQLSKKEVTVMYLAALAPPLPAFIENFESLYYARRWEPEVQRAQPNHSVIWQVERGSQFALAAARTYLDVSPSEFLHNGGFPPDNDQPWLEDLGFQPFFPQFNARLTTLSGGLPWSRG